MKTIHQPLVKKIGTLLLASFALLSCNSQQPDRGPGLSAKATTEAIEPGHAAAALMPAQTLKTSKKKIKIALLLDTSNSMDGLIDQAKSQLWKLVNELSLASVDNEKPQLEIALYEYGNTNLPANEGYIRQVSTFTSDLDLVSEHLFSLSTMGGDEYCGQVIRSSTDQLDWGSETGDYKVIFIAGNEEFTQGSVSYKKSCTTAKEKDIFVNTIFCGDFKTGLETGWKNGAMLASGEYMNIDQDQKTIYIETPYDAEIAKLNDKLNATYVSYGSLGFSKQQNQLKQDANAGTYGAANATTRIVSKSSALYTNADWDLVDRSKEKNFDVSKLSEQELPKELKGKTKEEKQQYIDQKNKEREEIKKQIAELNKKRVEYIAEKEKQLKPDQKSLDAAMLKAIRTQAGQKGFVFAEK
jgi:hypothetical protein